MQPFLWKIMISSWLINKLCVNVPFLLWFCLIKTSSAGHNWPPIKKLQSAPAWLFGFGLHKQHLLWRHGFLFTFAAFVPLIRGPRRKKGMFWDFTVEWHLFFLGWQQPRSPGLFPQGYFLLISLALCDFFSTYGTHRSLRTETQTHTNGCEFNMHSTCPSRAWKFKKKITELFGWSLKHS